MQNRREFLKTAAFAALGSGMAINGVLASERVAPALFNINKSGVVPRMKLRFFPYELKLRHVFTVAAYSRTTTPDVQVEIEYDGIIGYGEASMPPYLQLHSGHNAAFIDVEQCRRYPFTCQYAIDSHARA